MAANQKWTFGVEIETIKHTPQSVEFWILNFKRLPNGGNGAAQRAPSDSFPGAPLLWKLGIHSRKPVERRELTGPEVERARSFVVADAGRQSYAISQEGDRCL
jgi:hypothetical protein